MTNEKLLIGYVTSGALPSVTPEDARKMTHINVAFGHVKDAKVTVADTHNLDASASWGIQPQAWHPLSLLGGWSAGGFSELPPPVRRRLMATTAVKYSGKMLDGIDVIGNIHVTVWPALPASLLTKTSPCSLRKCAEPLMNKGRKTGGTTCSRLRPVQTSTLSTGLKWIRRKNTWTGYSL